MENVRLGNKNGIDSSLSAGIEKKDGIASSSCQVMETGQNSSPCAGIEMSRMKTGWNSFSHADLAGI